MAASVDDKLANAPRLSIVVLPFENLSGDKEQDYFADGITDDLTTDLSHLPESFVISRGTAFTYKGKPVDAKQIGRELGVRYMLEGSMRRVGDKISVNAQLISTKPGRIFGRTGSRASAPISANCRWSLFRASPIRSASSWSRPKPCAPRANDPATQTRPTSPCGDGRSLTEWIRRNSSTVARRFSSVRSRSTHKTSRR
jgi:TolB-like protein